MGWLMYLIYTAKWKNERNYIGASWDGDKMRADHMIPVTANI
jgi:hypothetical protein